MKKIQKKLTLAKGQSLFEVIVALAIAALVLTGVLALSTVSIRNSTFSKNNAQANRYSQEAMEWLRTQRDNDWTAFASNSSATAPYRTWCLSTLAFTSSGACVTPITNTIFVRNVLLQTIPPSTIEATVTVTWSDSQGQHRVVNTTRYTNWRR